MEDDPTPGTFGDYILLKEDLRMRQAPPKGEHFEQMLFNLEFLRNTRKQHGSLWCVYCGKKNLRIYDWREYPKNPDIMATADHFFPKSVAPHLAKDVDNLRVACCKCNNKKATDYWDEKFPYPKTE